MADNPYRPPEAPADDAPGIGAGVGWVALAALVGAVSVRIFTSLTALHMSWINGLFIGLAARRAARRRPHPQWPVIAVVGCIVALGFDALLHAGAEIALGIYAPIGALLLSAAGALRVGRAHEEADAMRLRDEDQRALFQRDERIAAPRATARALRLACASCGDLCDASDLEEIEGQGKICERCR